MKVDDDARERLNKIETAMNDTDRDGVVDYLDKENNTPAGVAVDSKGKFIDSNSNGVPDELEPNTAENPVIQNAVVAQNIEVLKELMTKGLINVFYDSNDDYPNMGSTNNYTLLSNT